MVLCCTFKASVVSLPGFLSLSETVETIPATVLKAWSTSSCLERRELHFTLINQGRHSSVISHMTRAAIFLEVYISLEWSQSLCPMF